MDDHPESEHVEEARLYLAKALLAKGQRDLAIPEFKALIEANPKGDFAAEVLFYLGTNLIRMGKEDEAVTYLEMLAKNHPRTRYRMDADLGIARLYMDRGQYKRSLKIFNKLSRRKLDRPDKLQYYSALSELQSKRGEYAKALKAISALDDFKLGNHMQATTMLRKGEAYAGLDSIMLAVDLYKTVSSRFPKSKYSAESEFRMAELYQNKLDSLNAAKEHYDQVPRQFPKSEFASQAIERSVSITRYQRLQSSIAEGQGEDNASVKFDLAETQLFQLKDYEKALATYQEVLTVFPNSEIAPKAAYAIGYIYAELLKDADKARLAFMKLINDYPESQQAEYARAYLEEHAEQLESRNQ
jgi:TolA-binding protein